MAGSSPVEKRLRAACNGDEAWTPCEWGAKDSHRSSCEEL